MFVFEIGDGGFEFFHSFQKSQVSILFFRSNPADGFISYKNILQHQLMGFKYFSPFFSQRRISPFTEFLQIRPGLL